MDKLINDNYKRVVGDCNLLKEDINMRDEKIDSLYKKLMKQRQRKNRNSAKTESRIVPQMLNEKLIKNEPPIFVAIRPVSSNPNLNLNFNQR